MLLWAFTIVNIITLSYLLSKGYDLKRLLNAVLKGITECGALFIIVMLMGATISAWLSSGIVPTLIYYGFGYMKGINLILAAFLCTMVISYVMGTACGTISTIGIALLGIGKGLAIPAPVLLGAIVSGSFIADKISPISSLTNLTIQLMDMDYRRYIKSCVKTLLPAVLLASAIYYALGSSYGSGADPVMIQEYQNFIRQGFVISPLLLLFPIFVVILAFSGIKTVYNMGIGVGAASLITLFVQKESLGNLIRYILWGYKANTGMVQLDSLISGGGVMGIIEVVFIIAGSISLSCLFEEANLLEPITDFFYKKDDKIFSLITKTSLLSILLNIVTCDQTVGILIPAKFGRTKFDEAGLDRGILARTISDTGTIIAPLLPWNVNALIIYGITGISALSYAPYAVLCYIFPLVTIAGGGILAKKKKNAMSNAEKIM